MEKPGSRGLPFPSRWRNLLSDDDGSGFFLTSPDSLFPLDLAALLQIPMKKHPEDAPVNHGVELMLYDMRTYRCRPGTIAAQLELYEQYGWEVQRKHLGEPLIFSQVETGDVNTYIHIWVYDSAADRETRRKAMVSDPQWQLYLKQSASAGNLVQQSNTLVRPAPFFDPTGKPGH